MEWATLILKTLSIFFHGVSLSYWNLLEYELNNFTSSLLDILSEALAYSHWELDQVTCLYSILRSL